MMVQIYDDPGSDPVAAGPPIAVTAGLIKPSKTAGVHWWEGGREACYPWLIPAGKLVSAHRAWRHTLHGGCAHRAGRPAPPTHPFLTVLIR